MTLADGRGLARSPLTEGKPEGHALVEWLNRFAGSYGDADGVGHDAVDEALARAEKVIEEQRRRLADLDA